MTSLIFNKYSTEESVRTQVGWLDEILSGDLDVVINSDLLDDLLPLVLELLLPHSRRWRAVLVTQGALGIHYVSQEINKVALKFPRLRVFACARVNTGPRQGVTASRPIPLEIKLDNFEPRLDSVELAGMSIGFAKDCPILANLTYLSLALTTRCPLLSCTQLIYALKACPDLGTFRLVAPSLKDDLNSKDAKEPVILNALTNMEFTVFRGNESSAILLNTLRFPKLVRLKFTHLDHLRYTEEQPLLDLQELTLTTSFEDLKLFFKTYCSLESLHSIIIELTSFDEHAPMEPRISLPAATIFSLTSEFLYYAAHSVMLHFDVPKIQRFAIVHPAEIMDTALDQSKWREAPIELPSMDHIAIKNLRQTSVHHCFSRMGYTALRKLTIADGPRGGKIWTTLREEYPQFLYPVEELELLISEGADDVSALYHFMHNVRRVYLMLEGDNPDWVTRLGGPAEGEEHKYEGLPLPKLEHLTLSCSAVEAKQNWTEIMRGVILRRQYSGIPLKELFYDIHISRQDKQWFSSYVDFSPVQCTFK
jgi:hypothetical protein